MAADQRPGLYVHIPFCSAICPYCDFAVVKAQHPQRSSFVSHLLREIEVVAAGRHPHWPGGDDHRQTSEKDLGPDPLRAAPFSTVYLGGGTPSALTVSELSQLKSVIESSLALADDVRWSIEVNPEDVSEASLGDWASLGFGYLSIGVQSFDDDALEFLGRRHSAEQAVRACGLAMAAPFETVSIDLMSGFERLPEPTWLRVLERAASFGSGHLSCYELTIHEGTAFWRRQQQGALNLLDEDRRADLLRLTIERLDELGYQQYEVSNFARSAHDQSPHNQKYWQSVPYLGLGPGAHSFAGATRWSNHRSLARWARALDSGSPIATSEVLSCDQQKLEWLLTRARTRGGLDLEEYRMRFGECLLSSHTSALDRLTGRGLLKREGDVLVPTLEGLLIADTVAIELSS